MFPLLNYLLIIVNSFLHKNYVLGCSLNAISVVSLFTV